MSRRTAAWITVFIVRCSGTLAMLVLDTGARSDFGQLRAVVSVREVARRSPSSPVAPAM